MKIIFLWVEDKKRLCYSMEHMVIRKMNRKFTDVISKMVFDCKRVLVFYAFFNFVPWFVSSFCGRWVFVWWWCVKTWLAVRRVKRRNFSENHTPSVSATIRLNWTTFWQKKRCHFTLVSLPTEFLFWAVHFGLFFFFRWKSLMSVLATDQLQIIPFF